MFLKVYFLNFRYFFIAKKQQLVLYSYITCREIENNQPGCVACERRRISGCRLSPPKTNVCEHDFRDVESFVFSLANQITR